MAWVIFRDKSGKTYKVPKNSYYSMFSSNTNFSLEKELKPISLENKEEKQKEIVKDDVRKYNTNETINARKGTKKII